LRSLVDAETIQNTAVEENGLRGGGGRPRRHGRNQGGRLSWEDLESYGDDDDDTVIQVSLGYFIYKQLNYACLNTCAGDNEEFQSEKLSI
jgi:hypothetical protein